MPRCSAGMMQKCVEEENCPVNAGQQMKSVHCKLRYSRRRVNIQVENDIECKTSEMCYFSLVIDPFCNLQCQTQSKFTQSSTGVRREKKYEKWCETCPYKCLRHGFQEHEHNANKTSEPTRAARSPLQVHPLASS